MKRRNTESVIRPADVGGGALLCWLAAVLAVAVCGGLHPAGAWAEAGGAALSAEQLTAFAPHFLLVKVHFKRSEEEAVNRPEDFDFYEEMTGSPSEMYQTFIEQKRPLKMMAIVVEPDTALTTDTILDDDYIERIEVEDAAGNVSPATRLAILKNAPGLLIKIAEPQKLAIQPVKFADLAAPVMPATRLFELGCSAQAEDRILWTAESSWGVRVGRDGSKETFVLSSPQGDIEQFETMIDTDISSFMTPGFGGRFEAAKAATLVLDEAKKPVGVALYPRLPAEPGKAPLWQGKDLMADERLSFEAINQRKTEIKTQFDGVLLEIKVTFRQKAEPDASSPWDIAAMMGAGRFGEGGMAPPEMYYYGMPVASRRLFVPARIQREFAKMIDTITVTAGEKTLTGTFGGVFEDIAAFLVTVEEDLPTPALDLTGAKELTPFDPIMSITAERRLGGKGIRVNYTRATSKTRGYKDVVEQQLLGHQAVGTFYANVGGQVRAVFVEQRKEDEEAQALREGMPFGSFSPYSMMTNARVYAMSELAGYFSEPAGHMDNTIVALSEDQEHRRLWLGVEFEPMTPELAKFLGIEKQTKDGGIGLVISAIYPQSPAERLGLQSGDILLKLKKVAEGEPIELQSGPDYESQFDFSDFKLPPGLDTLGIEMPSKRRWKSRDTVLTKLLEVIGEGQQVELTYLTGAGQLATKTFAPEVAPPDFDSAPKLKDKDLGLTVKEVTYEVRMALKIPDNLRPLVVAKVEEGTPAAVAKIKEYDLIMKVNDTDIAGLDSLKQVLATTAEAKKAQGKAVLRITLQRLDQTQIADVTLE